MKRPDGELERARIQLSTLVRQGAELLGSRYRSELSHQEFVDAARFRGWRAGCLAFLHEALGADSPYFREFESCCDSPYASAVARGSAILAAVREYVDSGPVSRLEELAAAEVMLELLAIAQRLLKSGATAPTVVTLGALLEAVMRRLARRCRIDFHEDRDDLASLNRKLGATAYSASTAARVEQWAAAVMQPDHTSSDEAARMLAFVRGFIADHLV